MLPDFLEDGNLPIDGHPHPCTWREVRERFGNGDHRAELLTKLHRLLKRAKDCRFLKVIIMGSFVTARPNPNDFDLIWLTDEEFEKDRLTSQCRELVESARSRDRFGCDLLNCPENSEFLPILISYEKGLGYDKVTKKPRGLVILDLVTDDLS
jgi:hypothetical protein